MDEMIIFWLVLLIALIVIEVLTMGLTTIWFAGGLNAPVWLQVLLFFGTSLILLLFTRPVAVKYFNRDRIKTNVESMVGRQAIVISEIDNVHGIGLATVGGQEWTARSCDDKVRIPAGAVVDVVAIHGVKLIVRLDQNVKGNSPEQGMPIPMSVSQMEDAQSRQH